MTTFTAGLDVHDALRPTFIERVRHAIPARPWKLLAAIAAGVIAIAAALPPRVAVVSPAVMMLREEAAGTGLVKAKVVAAVGARINGIVTATLVDQGDRVRRGQVIAELSSDDLQAQVRQAGHQLDAQHAMTSAARANVSAAKARLDASSSALSKTKASLQLASLTLVRVRSLHADGIASRESLDGAEAAQTVAAREVDEAASSRSAASQALLAIESEAHHAERVEGVSAASVELQRANLAYTVVRSPFDGLVVSRELERGATVVPGLPIFTIADPSVVWVSANIDQREAGGLRVGQPALVTRRSSGGRKIAATVARIAREADPVTEEVTVDVAFAAPVDILLNETAEVEIVKRTKPRALAVPATALVAGEQGDAVWVVRRGRLALQRVETGVRDKRGLVEIVRGLSPSDSVVGKPALERSLESGRRVRTGKG